MGWTSSSGYTYITLNFLHSSHTFPQEVNKRISMTLSNDSKKYLDTQYLGHSMYGKTLLLHTCLKAQVTYEHRKLILFMQDLPALNTDITIDGFTLYMG